MDNRREGEPQGEFINRIAIEDGEHPIINVGINSVVFKDTIFDKNGWLFLNENCNLSMDKNIAFIVFDLRNVSNINLAKKRCTGLIHVINMFAIFLICAVLFSGVVVGCIIYNNANNPAGMFDVSYGLGLTMRAELTPIWFVLITFMLAFSFRQALYAVDIYADSKTKNDYAHMTAVHVKKYWKEYIPV